MAERYSKAAMRTRAVQSAAERAILIALAEQADDEEAVRSIGITLSKGPACREPPAMKIVARLAYRAIEQEVIPL